MAKPFCCTKKTDHSRLRPCRFSPHSYEQLPLGTPRNYSPNRTAARCSPFAWHCSHLTNTPGLRLRIVLSNYRRGRSKNYGVIRDASHHHRIDPDNTITAYCQLSSWAYDGSPTANPTALTNSNSATLRNTLFEDWCRDIFVLVIMV